MLYNNLPELQKILDENNLYTEKKFGQNFLINTSIIEKIIEAANLQEDEYIIEIGPGLGILTNELIKKSKNVSTIELDDKLIPYLKRTFQNTNLDLIHQDALKFTPPNKPYKLIANIPYYITSPLIQHFLNPKSNSASPISLTLLIQKEVADKICAKPGDHTVLSLQTQIFGTPKKLFEVKAGNFYPAPKVNSAVIQITTHSKPLTNNPSLFIDLIKMCFSQKRKKLTNTLKGFLKKHKSTKTPAQILELSNISLESRPQHLSIENWNQIIANL